MPRRPKDDPQGQPQLEVFNLGLEGVNVVDSPLHLSDGELVHAQHAQVSQDDAEGALVKRPALGQFSTDGMGGPVLGFVSVPLPDPPTPPFLPWFEGLQSDGVQAHEGADGRAQDLWFEGLPSTLLVP